MEKRILLEKRGREANQVRFVSISRNSDLKSQIPQKTHCSPAESRKFGDFHKLKSPKGAAERYFHGKSIVRKIE